MEVIDINVRFVFTYKCETCDAQFTVRSNLSTHIKSQYQGVKYVDCVIIMLHRRVIYLDKTTIHHRADQMTKLN